MTIKLVGSTSGSVALDAPASTTSGADVTFKLPVADGSASQLLKTDGSGNLGWASDVGTILQVITVTKTDVFTTTNTTISGSHPWGNDVSGLAASITMTAAGNKVLVLLNTTISNSDTNYYTYMYLYRGTALLGGNTAKTGSGALHTNDVVINRLDAPGAGTHTYLARVACEGNTAYVGQGQNGTNDDRIGDSTLILMEVAV